MFNCTTVVKQSPFPHIEYGFLHFPFNHNVISQRANESEFLDIENIALNSVIYYKVLSKKCFPQGETIVWPLNSWLSNILVYISNANFKCDSGDISYSDKTIWMMHRRSIPMFCFKANFKLSSSMRFGFGFVHLYYVMLESEVKGMQRETSVCVICFREASFCPGGLRV